MMQILNHPLISQRYFFPRRGAFPDPFWVDCGDARLACSYHEVDPAARTLVHFHGNGEIVDDWRGDFARLINQMGCNCFLAELRGYGQSSGRPELGRMLDDVGPTLEALGQPGERLVFFGRSVGSLFALEAVAQCPEASGLILESAVADVRERLLLRVSAGELGVTGAQLDTAIAERLDHRRKLQTYPGALLVMHARHDDLVDVSHGQRLYDWGTGPKSLKIFPRGGHNDLMFVNAREYFARIEAFLSALP